MSEESRGLSELLVGVVMQDRSLLTELLQSVNPTDLDPPYSQALALLVRQPPGPLNPYALQKGLEQASPGLSADFVTTTAQQGLPALFDWYLARFREGLARRRISTIPAITDVAARMDDLRLGIEKVKEAVADAEAALQPQRLPMVEGELLWDYVAPAESILMPGLLWRQARAMFTGFEGEGKSIMLRQLAIAGALGVHPFKTHGTIEPIRTLYLDLENPPTLTQSIMRTMLETLRDRGAVKDRQSFEGRFKFDIRTDGLDIVGKGRDREYLTRAISTHRPDLLCIGPVYRLAAGGGDLDEATVAGVMDYLNHLRSTYDIAIATEAHAPHGPSDGRNPNSRRVLRPSGSSAWMRFPEVGRGLRHDENASDRLGRLTYRLERWRNDRSVDMKFPEYLARGINGQVWFDDVSDQVLAEVGR